MAKRAEIEVCLFGGWRLKDGEMPTDFPGAKRIFRSLAKDPENANLSFRELLTLAKAISLKEGANPPIFHFMNEELRNKFEKFNYSEDEMEED